MLFSHPWVYCGMARWSWHDSCRMLPSIPRSGPEVIAATIRKARRLPLSLLPPHSFFCVTSITVHRVANEKGFGLWQWTEEANRSKNIGRRLPRELELWSLQFVKTEGCRDSLHIPRISLVSRLLSELHFPRSSILREIMEPRLWR